MQPFDSPFQGKQLLQKKLGFASSLFSPPLPHSLSTLFPAAATGNLLDLEDPAKSPLTSSANSPHLDNSMFGPSSSVNNNVVWVSVYPGHRDICRTGGMQRHLRFVRSRSHRGAFYGINPPWELWGS